MKKTWIYLCIVLLMSTHLNVQAQTTPEDMGWKLCVGSYTFRLFTFAESLEKVNALGLKYIEMATAQKIGGGIDGTTAYTMEPSTRKAILQLCKKYGIKILSYGVITGKDEKDWNDIFKFAKGMGIKTILSEPKSEQLDMVERLAKKYKINVAIHNHAKPTVYWDPKVVVAAIDGRSKRIGVCADNGHWLRSELDPIDCMKTLEGRIIEFHFKDMNEKGMQGHNVIWGTGIADVKSMIKEMKRQNFKGAVTVEYEYNWENSFSDIRESLKNFTLYTNEL